MSTSTLAATAYCGHAECQTAVDNWVAAGHPAVEYERTGPVMTHRSEVLFYARRDWLADCHEAAVAKGRESSEEQHDAWRRRVGERRRREQRRR